MTASCVIVGNVLTLGLTYQKDIEFYQSSVSYEEPKFAESLIAKRKIRSELKHVQRAEPRGGSANPSNALCS